MELNQMYSHFTVASQSSFDQVLINTLLSYNDLYIKPNWTLLTTWLNAHYFACYDVFKPVYIVSKPACWVLTVWINPNNDWQHSKSFKRCTTTTTTIAKHSSKILGSVKSFKRFTYQILMHGKCGSSLWFL